jgi:hypothetical protein
MGSMRVTNDQAQVQELDGPGGAIPDYVFPHRLGPYARLQRWRSHIRQPTGRRYVPGSGTPPRQRGGRGLRTGGRRQGGSIQSPDSPGETRGRWVPTGWRVIGYRTWGPLREALRQVDFISEQLWDQFTGRRGGRPDTFFEQYLSRLSRSKLEYMMLDRTARYIHVPVWEELDYDEARTEAARPPTTVHHTMFYVVEIVSETSPRIGGYLREGTYRSNADFPITVWANGWQDPADWDGVDKVADHIWREQYEYEVTHDPELGLTYAVDRVTGEPKWHTVWMTRFYIFGGIDTGEREEIRNPSNYEGNDPLPAPTLIDVRDGDVDSTDPYDQENPFRRNYFTVMAMVRKPGQSETWTRRFGNASPSGSVHAMAQAQIYNASSWDFWTQDWRAQLTPMTDWEDWVARLEDGQADAAAVHEVLDADEIDRALQYLRALGPDLFDRYRWQ